MKPRGRSARLLSRPALTVQDVTVESANPPLLPPVSTLASDSRPAPDAAPLLERSKRSPRGACDFRRNSLAVLRLLVSTSVPEIRINVKWVGLGNGFPPPSPKERNAPFIPVDESQGLSGAEGGKSALLLPLAARRKEFCEDTSRSGKGRPPSALLLGGNFYIALAS